jgi:hypothetical protein
VRYSVAENEARLLRARTTRNPDVAPKRIYLFLLVQHSAEEHDNKTIRREVSATIEVSFLLRKSQSEMDGEKVRLAAPAAARQDRPISASACSLNHPCSRATTDKPKHQRYP